MKTTPITVKEYLKNEVAKKDKLLGAKALIELINHYTKLYENKADDKSSDSNIYPQNECTTFGAITITICQKGKEENQR